MSAAAESPRPLSLTVMGHAGLLALTWVPLLLVSGAWLLHGADGFARLPGIGWVIAVTGSGHVATSAYLYIDGGVRDLIKADTRRFVLAPLLLCAAYVSIAALGGIAFAALLP